MAGITLMVGIDVVSLSTTGIDVVTFSTTSIMLDSLGVGAPVGAEVGVVATAIIVGDDVATLGDGVAGGRRTWLITAKTKKKLLSDK